MTGHRREFIGIGVGTLLLAGVGVLLVHRRQGQPGGARQLLPAQRPSNWPERRRIATHGPTSARSTPGSRRTSAPVHLGVHRDRHGEARRRRQARAGAGHPRLLESRAPRAARWRCRSRRWAPGSEPAPTRRLARRDAGRRDSSRPNEVEMTTARRNAQQAQVLESRARLAGTSLEVRDCVLKAPFDGEIATRTMDPGAFVRPGTRSCRSSTEHRAGHGGRSGEGLRPRPGLHARPHPDARDGRRGRRQGVAPISPSRRQGRARSTSRWMSPTPVTSIPAGTTATGPGRRGRAVPATEIPLYAATQHEGKAKFFVVEGGVARARHPRPRRTQRGRLLRPEASSPAGAQVVTEGRALSRTATRSKRKRRAATGACRPRRWNPRRRLRQAAVTPASRSGTRLRA
jgi:multidrug efflux pump subunit AcrA (membrane-fusion protein)